MPYSVHRDGQDFVVVNDETHTQVPGGRHSSKADALGHLRALYANVKKAAEPQRYLLALAYQAGMDDNIAKGVDGHRDFFTPDELEKAAWSFIPNGANVGLFHGPEATYGHFQVTESYIYRGPPWDCGDGIVIKSGDWLVGGICDEVAWDLYERGLITGMSPQGTATRRKVVNA